MTETPKPILNLLSEFKEKGAYPAFRVMETAGTEPEVTIAGERKLSFCSNNYLGLSLNKEIKEAAHHGIDVHGMGPGGARILCGNIKDTVMLEEKLSKFLSKEDALTFPTGYMANLAVFQSLTHPLFLNVPFEVGSSVIVSDELNHASIIEGCRATKALKLVFAHNNLADLERKLKKGKRAKGNKVLVTEGVFSMEGEVSPLPEIVQLAKKYSYMIVLDDAHGVGVLGGTGAGTADYYDVVGDIDVIMGSFDKAFGGVGGFLAGNKELIDYLRIASRPSVFSSALPAVYSLAMTKAIEIVAGADNQRKQARGLAARASEGLKKAGFQVSHNSLLSVVAVRIGSDEKGIQFEKLAYEEGILAPVIRWPAVPNDESRMRLVFTASHKGEHVLKILEIFTRIGKKLRII